MRQFLIYEADSSFNQMWNRYEAEFARLTREKNAEEAYAKKKNKKLSSADNSFGIDGKSELLCWQGFWLYLWLMLDSCITFTMKHRIRKKIDLPVKNLKNAGLLTNEQKSVGWNIRVQGTSLLIA